MINVGEALFMTAHLAVLGAAWRLLYLGDDRAYQVGFVAFVLGLGAMAFN